MELLEVVKNKIESLGNCSGAYRMAHAAWSACDHRQLPGPSLLEVSSGLDSSNKQLFCSLLEITSQPDYSNKDQANMLYWLDEKGFSDYVSKQVGKTKEELVDWK